MNHPGWRIAGTIVFGALGLFLASQHEWTAAGMLAAATAACWLPSTRRGRIAALSVFTITAGYATYWTYGTTPRHENWWMPPVFYAIVIGCAWFRVLWPHAFDRWHIKL